MTDRRKWSVAIARLSSAACAGGFVEVAKLASRKTNSAAPRTLELDEAQQRTRLEAARPQAKEGRDRGAAPLEAFIAARIRREAWLGEAFEEDDRSSGRSTLQLRARASGRLRGWRDR